MSETMVEKSKIDVPRIKRVLAYIEEDIRRLEMTTWAMRPNDQTEKLPKSMPPCGTVACFAGWTYLLDLKERDQQPVFDEEVMTEIIDEEPIKVVGMDGYTVRSTAERLLGLSGENADWLFSPISGTPKTQLKQLKEKINRILEINDIEERV